VENGCSLWCHLPFPPHPKDNPSYSRQGNALPSKHTNILILLFFYSQSGTSKTNEASKKYPRIHVVNPNWLIDSIYHEGAQDESLYRYSSGGPSAPSSNDDVANPESTPLDLEDGAFDNKQLDLKDVDWNDADDEVNAFLSDDSDDDDDDDDEQEEEKGTPSQQK
jgi:RNA polymerase II subunit A-like phosphatase